MTPNGWVHEQSSRKVVLGDNGQPQEIIVHERGLNSYVRIGPDRLAPAIAYWESNHTAWADIRAAWEPILGLSTVQLNGAVHAPKLVRQHAVAARAEPRGAARLVRRAQGLCWRRWGQ